MTTDSADITARIRGRIHTAITEPTPSAPDNNPKPLAETSRFLRATTGITDVSDEVTPSTTVNRRATLRNCGEPTMYFTPSPIA
ncbi:MAG: hypothetical protein WCJ08_06560 [bacterium]